MSSRIFIACLILLSGNILCLAGHKDYSKRGGEFSILKDIRLDARKLEFFDKRLVELEGFRLEASVFNLYTTVTIQTVESPVSQGSVWEDLDAEYELIVGEDKENKLHNKLIDDIYQFWLSNPRDNSIVGEKNVTLRIGSYLIFSGHPYPDLVWFGNRFVKIEFKRFTNPKKSGLGAEQSFWEDAIRFYDSNNKRVKLEYLVNGLQDEFLQWYKAGRFKR